MPKRVSDYGQSQVFPDPMGSHIATETAAAAARFIAATGWTDHLIGLMTLMLAKAGEHASFFRWMRTIKNDTQRRTFMIEFAKVSLEGDELDSAFSDLLARTNSVAAHRHKLAHRLWYAVPARPDLIAVVPSIKAAEAVSRWEGAWATLIAMYSEGKAGSVKSPDLSIIESAEVYERGELESLTQVAFDLGGVWRSFHEVLVRRRVPRLRDSGHDGLKALVERIQQVAPPEHPKEAKRARKSPRKSRE